MRQIVLDTETTGLEPQQGHRIIEIGCVELESRRATGRHFHHYIQPDREVDEGALAVHGISNEFLADKPRFEEIVDEFVGFVRGAELVIHNAPFDVGFLDAEFARLGESYAPVRELCSVTDSLVLARQMHPGQRNSLDALCKRYGVNNEHRELHGALLDARILADVYLVMTGGQTALSLGSANDDNGQDEVRGEEEGIRRLDSDRPRLRVLAPDQAELQRHHIIMKAIAEANGGQCLWPALEE